MSTPILTRAAATANTVPLKIIALPRDPNPYQRLLYREVERAGHSVRYARELTSSRTLNVLLLPIELTAYRLLGWTILHIHWVFAFNLPGSDRFPLLRTLSQAWFRMVLATCRLLGIRVVWSVHNVLPHQRVFHDDLAARRWLVRACELVIVHSHASLEALEAVGIRPRRSVVVPHGPVDLDLDASALRAPGAGRSIPKLLFFGEVAEYKGVEDLLCAMRQIPEDAAPGLLVVGRCGDAKLRERLQALASSAGDRVELRLVRLPEHELRDVLADSDVVVLPYRRVTTSGSALLAMGHGRVVILPDLPAFREVPRDAAIFYDGSVEGLRQTIIDTVRLPSDRLHQVGRSASSYVSTLSWTDAASRTIASLALGS